VEPRNTLADDRMPEHPVGTERHAERPDACRARSPKIPGCLTGNLIGGSQYQGKPGSPGNAGWAYSSLLLIRLGVVRLAGVRIPLQVDQGVHSRTLGCRVRSTGLFSRSVLRVMLFGVHSPLLDSANARTEDATQSLCAHERVTERSRNPVDTDVTIET